MRNRANDPINTLMFIIDYPDTVLFVLAGPVALALGLLVAPALGLWVGIVMVVVAFLLALI